jgi:hypothetical protein
MNEQPKIDFLAILQTLAEHRVDFIIVGGVCAVLHGAPIATFDLDLVHSRTPANISRLVAALGALNARGREKLHQQIRPDESRLSSPGHQLLMTRFGPLDLLGTAGVGRGYDELLPRSTELPLTGGLRVRLLDLDALIELKTETGRDKDKAVLSILRQTLEERRKT